MRTFEQIEEIIKKYVADTSGLCTRDEMSSIIVRILKKELEKHRVEIEQLKEELLYLKST